MGTDNGDHDRRLLDSADINLAVDAFPGVSMHSAFGVAAV